MPHEIVVARSQRNGYDHALRAAGARLIEVGLAERTRDPQPWELAAAITPRTVAFAYFADFSSLPLESVVAVARQHGLPVIVDASATLPPRANLQRFSNLGADLVAYSGGKGLGGPQSSGILCGRKTLIASAALQMWDLDFPAELWHPPAELIPHAWTARGIPNHGLGRGLKVGREEIVGLWTALERFLARDEAAYVAEGCRRARFLAERLARLPGLRVETIERAELWPRLVLHVAPTPDGRAALQLAQALEAATPAVFVAIAEAAQGRLGIEPASLTDDEAQTVVDQFTSLWPPR